MTSFQKSAIISCKTCLGGGVLWHLHQEIVHRGAEQIQEKIQRAVLQRAHRREQKDQPPIQEAGNRQRRPDRMWISR